MKQLLFYFTFSLLIFSCSSGDENLDPQKSFGYIKIGDDSVSASNANFVIWQDVTDGNFEDYEIQLSSVPIEVQNIFSVFDHSYIQI